MISNLPRLAFEVAICALHCLLHISLWTVLLIIYGISLSSFHKLVSVILALHYWFTLYIVESLMWHSHGYWHIGTIYFLLSILCIPFTIMTLYRKWIRILAPILTLLYSIFLVMKHEIYAFSVIPYLLFWVIVIDLYDCIVRQGLSRKSFYLISEISVGFSILCTVALGYQYQYSISGIVTSIVIIALRITV